jgi:hypothetical protein
MGRPRADHANPEPARSPATLEAANDVAFFVPLNPTDPADFQAKT